MLVFINSATGGEGGNKMGFVSWETGCLEGARVSCQRPEDGKAKKSAGWCQEGE